MEKIGEMLPVVIVVFVVGYGLVKKVSVFTSFTNGVKKGLATTISILPTLIGIITAITMLSSSGALDAFANIISPFANKIGFPSEILPLVILRPISGSGANSVVINLFETYGVDSDIGNIASVLSASSETTLYAVSVYFGNKGYKSLKYTLPVALFGDFVIIVFAIALTIVLL